MDAKTNKAKKTETKDEKIKRLEEQVKLLERHLERRSERYLKDQQTISKLNRMLEQGMTDLEKTYGLVSSMIVLEYGEDDKAGGKELYVPYLQPEELKNRRLAVETEKDADGRLTGMTFKVYTEKE